WTMTWKPSCDSFTATARPMPDVEPVTSAFGRRRPGSIRGSDIVQCPLGFRKSKQEDAPTQRPPFGVHNYTRAGEGRRRSLLSQSPKDFSASRQAYSRRGSFLGR